MKPRTLLLLLVAGIIACAVAALAGLLVMGLGVILEVLTRLRAGYGPSCVDCLNREGLWCRCRPLVERLRPGLQPEAPGRVPLKWSWSICQGDFFRGRG
jgi:hypothetical protein